MSSLVDEVRQIVRHDIDPEFLKKIAIAIYWAYAELYDELASNPDLTDAYRIERFAQLRGHRVAMAIARVSKQCGVPFNFRRLDCNGQEKLLVKAGRVIVLQEPILSLNEAPRSSDYKRELADTHAVVRQLEFDFGDQPNRIRDWSGSVLGVILHGACGPDFSAQHKMLGGLFLAVPDEAYEGWLVRLDLHRIAFWGTSEEPTELDQPGDPEGQRPPMTQSDRVNVTPKKKDKEEEPE